MRNEIPPEIMTPLCSAVGEFVVSWAVLEMGLDSCIAVIYQVGGGKHLSKKIPRQISLKVRFLQACISHVGAVQPFANEGREILSRVDAITETRHMIVHGCVTKYFPQDHQFEFVKLDLDKDKTRHTATTLRITAQELLDQSGEALALGATVQNFAWRLIDALVPEEVASALISG